MAEIWLATSSDFPDLWSDDQLLLSAFKEAGHVARAAVWSDPDLDWSTPDAVIIRSCWDYFHRADDFAAWLAVMRVARTELINAPDLIAWNMDKHYLSDLGSRGVEVPHITWFELGEELPDLGSLLREHGLSQVVYKPAISGNALHTWRGSLATIDEDRARLASLTSERAMMLQPFFPEIIEEGEVSLIFFGGAFSHAVKKVPAEGDFRVQAEYGGAVIPITPSEELIAQAANVLAGVREGDCVYARVDGVVTEARGFVLMELEVIEPELFFRTSSKAPSALVSAVLDLL